MRRINAVLGLLAILTLSWSGSAEAQDRDALDTLRFNPVGGSDGGVVLTGVTIGEPWQLDAALWLQFARRPLMFTSDGENIEPAIPARLSTVLHAGFTIAERVRLDLDLPLVLYQGGVDPRDSKPLARGGAGDIRFTPQVLILDPDRAWMGLALSAPISFPTGREDALLGANGPTLQPRVHLEKRFAFAKIAVLKFAVSAEVGWRFRERSKLLDLDTDDEFTFGFGARWEPTERFRMGTELLYNIGAGTNARSGEWVTWLRVTPDRKKNVDILGGVALGAGRGIGTAETRVFLGVRARLLPPSRPRPPAVDPHPAVQSAAPELGEQPPATNSDSSYGWGLRLVGRTAVIPSSVLFDFDKSVLSSEAGPVLDNIVAWFRAHDEGLAMEVAGHCDLRGSHAYNDRLSNERARAVWRYLVEHGLPAHQVSSVGYGKRAVRMKPAEGTADEVHAANRRVEFLLLSPEEFARRAEARASTAVTK